MYALVVVQAHDPWGGSLQDDSWLVVEALARPAKRRQDLNVRYALGKNHVSELLGNGLQARVRQLERHVEAWCT